jgi:predicted enzyme related to lactoylglutathione lyase
MSTVETAVGRFVWHDHMSGDPEAAQRFYADLLGWDFEIFDTGDSKYPMIKVGDTTHGGFGAAQGGGPASWLGHIYVDDVDAVAERVTAAGGTIVSPPMDIPNVGRWVVAADPQGAVISFYTSVSPDYAPSEGVFVWDELTTTDVESSKRFYGEVVGWESRDSDMGNGYTYTLFSSGGVDRAGCGPKMPGDESPPAWMPYIGADVDATLEKAKGLGSVTVFMEPMDIPTVGRLAIFADPTGAAVGLFQPE